MEGIADRTRIADRIFGDLRDDILEGRTPAGTRLPSERELPQRYGVSGPTVREAVRGLSLLGLVNVRHGSGATVTADTAMLMAAALGPVIRIARLGVEDVLGVYGGLIEQAAGFAAAHAQPFDTRRLHASLAALDRAREPAAAQEAVRGFHASLAAASHNPLLIALCGFLAELQLELARALAESDAEAWRRMLARLRAPRRALVEAIGSGHAEVAAAAARAFNGAALAAITALPKAREVRSRDPQLRDLLASATARVAAG